MVRIPKMLASYDLATGMEVDMSRQVLKSAEKSAGGFHAKCHVALTVRWGMGVCCWIVWQGKAQQAANLTILSRAGHAWSKDKLNNVK